MADSHVLFISKPTGYELRQGEGDPPPVAGVKKSWANTAWLSAAANTSMNSTAILTLIVWPLPVEWSPYRCSGPRLPA